VWAPLLLLCIAVFYFLNGSGKIGKEYLKVIFFWVLFALVVFTSFFFNADDFDFDIFRLLFVFFLVATIIPYAVFNFFKHNPIEIFKYIGLVSFINAFFIIGMFIFPDFKYFWLSLINSVIERHSGEIDITESMMSLRMVGIGGFSAYSTTVIQVSLTMCYLLYVYYKRGKPKIKDMLLIAIVIFSALVAGRTAFILLPFFLILYLYLFQFKSLLKLVVLFTFIFSFFIFLFTSLIDPKFIEFFMSWFLEIFQSGIEVGSLQANISMFSAYSFFDFSLLGDFRLRSDDGGYYQDTDVGYYRMMFSVGMLGMLFFLLFVFSPFYFRAVSSERNVAPINFTSLLISLMILIVLFKGAILFDAFPLISLFVILGFSIKYFQKRA
jgi:hypothetical protein